MLALEDIHGYYGPSHVLHGISLHVEEGEAVSLLGRNGAGKTTALLTIMGYLKPYPGRVLFKGEDISRLLPYRRSHLGLAFVPQERGIFRSLTVAENLTVCARGGKGRRWTLPDIYKLFPRLKERASNRGHQLSGGEQQLLAIARGLMMNPKILLLDEPSEGLSPMMVGEITAILDALKREGLAILIIEQNVHVATKIGDRHHILSKGKVVYSGSTEDLCNNDAVTAGHLGIY